MKIRISTLYIVSFCLFVLLSPMNNWFEVKAMNDGVLPYNGWAMYLTPPYMKSYKDIFIVFCFSIFLYRFSKKNNFYTKLLSDIKLLPFLLFFILLVSFTTIYAMFFDAYSAILALRSFWSVFFIFLGLFFYDVNQRKIFITLVIILFFQIFMQGYQFLTGAGYAVFADLRSPGIFIVPATAGAFSLILYYTGICLDSIPVKVISIVSLLLSNSTIGLVVLLTFFLYKSNFLIFKNNKALFYFFFSSAFILTICLFTIYAGTISGRGDGVFSSMTARVGIIESVFLDMNSHTFFWGDGFGSTTSQSILLGSSDSFVADNTLLGTYKNMGILGLILFFFMSISVFFMVNNKMLFFIFFYYSLTTNIFEMNPVIQILMTFIGIEAGRRFFYRGFN